MTACRDNVKVTLSFMVNVYRPANLGDSQTACGALCTRLGFALNQQ